MKKTLLSIIYFLACIFSIQAQVLYGTTRAGGLRGGGTINKFMPATNNLTVAKSFETIDRRPTQNFILASDGKLYGMTSGGGNNNDFGVIFSFDPSSSTYTKLKDFDNANGANPTGGLVQASDGKLYGMTIRGGSSGDGVIFSFDPSSSIYTKLKDFDYTNGSIPSGSLVQASDGKLYGMTTSGGSNSRGVIFSFDPLASTFTKLKDLFFTNGSSPYGSLIQASDGKLYGMTTSGGSNGRGVIFSFNPSASTYTKLKDFDRVNGGNPYGSLLQASNGKLYGMTTFGGSSDSGVIFSFDPSASIYTKLKDFNRVNGGNPAGSLIQASNGKIYGMTQFGGSGAGVIFSFDPSASTYTKLKDFDGANNFSSSGSLVQASDGKLYGMTGGGRTHYGVIFSFDPSASTYTKLKDISTNETGTNVLGSLVKANDGKLYGMTVSGGSSDSGVIFSFDPSASIYTKLKDFDRVNGAYPSGSLIQASDGKLYGMATLGGSNGVGVIFSFDPSSSTYTKLYDIREINIVTYPIGSLVQASDGKLYGMIYYSGRYGAGEVIFSFDLSSYTYTELKGFDDPYGIHNGSLMQASDGKLYGTAAGVIFSFDPLSSTYTKLQDFDGVNGALVQASDGKLYGMTAYGGSSGVGVIFSFDPLSNTYTKLKDFDNANGAIPLGSLMQASDGKLYGNTSNGGSNGLGVIFSYDISSSTYTKLQDYTGANGANPYSAFIEVNECSPRGVCSDKGFIKNVFACYSFNNTTGCTGYGDYSDRAVNTAAGKLLGFSVTPGYNSSTYQPLVYIRTWIDWNGDGDFTDAGELVYAPFHPVNVKTKFWIRVPAGTPAGKKRMRVAVSADYKMSPCGTIANGEVEDYTINVHAARFAARFAVPDAGPDAFDEAGETFTIYPNPVQNKMIIERSGYDEGKANNAPALMVLTNASGKMLMQSKLANLVQAVDVSRLPAGVYFVTIINGNNKTTNKIIINR